MERFTITHETVLQQPMRVNRRRFQPVLREQFGDEDYESDDKEGMDQIAADVQAETQEPEDDEDDDDGPKHDGVCYLIRR